jgi:hypothetical protein
VDVLKLWVQLVVLRQQVTPVLLRNPVAGSVRPESRR